MANRRRQTNIYDAAAFKALEGVPLPDKIKCNRCGKYKSQSNFSNRQLADARTAVKNSGPNARYKINCGPCTGQQIVEIECTMCHKTKGLDAFAKSQSKKPDSAKCFACIDEQVAQDAIEHDIYESDDRSKLFEPVESSSSAYPSVWTASTVTNGSEANDWDTEKGADDGDDGAGGGISFSTEFARGMSLGSSDHETLIETEYDRGSQANGNGEWTTVPAKSWHTRSANTVSTSSGFDPNKYGKPSTRSTSGSMSGSVRTFSSGYAERSDTASHKGGWAKIKAYDARKDPNAVPVTQPVQEEDWSSESEQEDDDDDSDDETEI